MKPVRPFSLVATAVLLHLPGARAATFTWDASGGDPLNDGAGAWTDSGGTNWYDGSAYGAWGNTDADEAVFGIGSGAAGTVGVGTVMANRITFNAPGSGSYTLSGGTITLAGTTPSVAANVSATVSSVLDGTGGLVKGGSGNLTLSAANLFSGGMSVADGTVIATGNNAALGAGDVTLGDGNTGSANVALLITAGRAITNNITISSSGSGTATLGRSGGGAFTRYTGGITLARDLVLQNTTTASDRISFDGNITGTGNLTIQGGGRVTLGGNNSFSGDVFIVGAGTDLQDISGSANRMIPDTARVDIGSESRYSVFQSETIGALTGSGTLRSLNPNPFLTVGGGNASGTFSGKWTKAVDGTAGPKLIKTGTGTLTLDGTDSDSLASLTINGGVVAAALIANGGVASSIGASANTANNLVFGSPTAALRYIGSSDVTTDRSFTMSGGGGGGATIESSGTGTLGFASGLVIGYGTNNQTRSLTLGGTNAGENVFGGFIDNNALGATSLIKDGPGSWTLSADNFYSGSTLIKAGTLALSGDGSMNNSSSLTIDPGAKLKTTARTATQILPTAVIFGLDSAGPGSSGRVEAGTLEIAAANVSFAITGTLNDSRYVLASYTSLAGTPAFQSVTVPAGYLLNYGSGTDDFITLDQISVGGGYDAWAAQITNGRSLRAEDADDDGFTNLQEYLFGTDPLSGNGSLTSVEKAGDTLIMRWKEREAEADADYQLTENASLVGTWTGSTAPVSDDGAAAGGYQPRKAEIPIGTDKLFFRVEGAEN